MRVLINGVSAVAGGGVTYFVNLLEWLPRLAPRDSFVLALPPAILPGANASNVEIERIAEAGEGVFTRLLWENFDLVALAKERKADLLFCPANIAPIRRPDIPLVLMMRNVAPLFPKVRKMLFQYEGIEKALQMMVLEYLTLASIRKASHVISLSEATQALFRKRIGDFPGSVLYHGVNPRFIPDVALPPSAPAKPYFLCVSNIYVYKGLEYIIEALKADPSLPQVIIVGKHFDTGYHRHIQSLVKEAGVGDRLIFKGAVPYDDLPGWYAHALALAYPSWCENCPNILLEAMACGCPVVAMRTGPMPEICGDTAFFARPFDGSSWGDAMRKAVAAASDRECRSRAVRRANTFSWERSIQSLLEVFSRFA